jgi:hypothetical protein
LPVLARLPFSGGRRVRPVVDGVPGQLHERLLERCLAGEEFVQGDDGPGGQLADLGRAGAAHGQAAFRGGL